MTKQFNKEEYNKLCAEFMGYKLITPEMRKNPTEWVSSYWENPEFNGSSKGVLCSESGLEYHINWNRIMEVVEKIEKTYAWVQIKGCHVLSASIDVNAPTKKEAVVQAIWEFLLWYNEQKQ